MGVLLKALTCFNGGFESISCNGFLCLGIFYWFVSVILLMKSRDLGYFSKNTYIFSREREVGKSFYSFILGSISNSFLKGRVVFLGF